MGAARGGGELFAFTCINCSVPCCRRPQKCSSAKMTRMICVGSCSAAASFSLFNASGPVSGSYLCVWNLVCQHKSCMATAATGLCLDTSLSLCPKLTIINM